MFDQGWRERLVCSWRVTKRVIKHQKQGLRNFFRKLLWSVEHKKHQSRFFQGSYRFLDPKFKTFFRLFSKTVISFSRLKVIKFICRWSIETLKNEGTKLSHVLQTYGQDLTKTKKIFKALIKALVVALKKNLRLFIIFVRLYLYFPDSRHRRVVEKKYFRSTY